MTTFAHAEIHSFRISITFTLRTCLNPVCSPSNEFSHCNFLPSRFLLSSWRWNIFNVLLLFVQTKNNTPKIQSNEVNKIKSFHLIKKLGISFNYVAKCRVWGFCGQFMSRCLRQQHTPSQARANLFTVEIRWMHPMILCHVSILIMEWTLQDWRGFLPYNTTSKKEKKGKC